MNSFESELKELIARHRDRIGVALEELVDALESEVELLVDEIDDRGGATW